MITARFLTVLAASSLAGIAYAQTQPAPSSQPGASPGYNTSNPQEQQMKTAPGHEEAPPTARPSPGSGLNTAQSQEQEPKHERMAEAGAGGQSWSDMQVENGSGESIGKVSKVIPGLDGKESSGYVLVTGANGENVPVPYRTAHSMVRDGKLVLSQPRFTKAPRVTDQDLENTSEHAWRQKADHFWLRKPHSHKFK